jgi:recombination protein RecA
MFTNQIRMKIGVMFGSPETTTGGNALKFYASQRLDIRRIGAIKEASKDKKGDMVVVGNRTRVKVVKNKMAPPFREAEFDILYGKGVSRSGEIVDMAVELNFIQKSGAWYSVGPERIGQGRDNARTYLDEHPELMGKLEAQLLAHHGIGVGPGGNSILPTAGSPVAGGPVAGSPTAAGVPVIPSFTGSAAADSGKDSKSDSGKTSSSKAVSYDDSDDEDEEGSSKARAVPKGNGNGSSRTAAAPPPPAKRAVRAN